MLIELKIYQARTNTIFPNAMKGISGGNTAAEPTPIRAAQTGEIAATVRPVAGPQVSTETARIRFKAEPVTIWLPSIAVANCTVTSSAVKTAVRVIHKTFLLIFIYTLYTKFALVFQKNLEMTFKNGFYNSQFHVTIP